MSYVNEFLEERNQEIATIKERKMILFLSDADCQRIAEKAGRAGMTVGELLENFIGDLVCGTYTNGSDERDCANQWFERCYFGMFPDETLLKHLLDYGEDVREFLDAVAEMERFTAHPEAFKSDIEDLCEGENLWFQDVYEDTIENFKKHWESTDEIDVEKEIEICRKWYADFQKLQEPYVEPKKQKQPALKSRQKL